MKQVSRSKNPFSAWAKFDPSRVCGRTRLFQDILEVTTEEEPKAVNLVGPRKIGKTTVMQHLVHPDGFRKTPEYEVTIGPSFTADRLLSLYVDLAQDYDPENPFAALLDTLHRAVRDRRDVDLSTADLSLLVETGEPTPKRSDTEQSIDRMVREISRQGTRIIVCLDHVDRCDALKDDLALRMIGVLTESVSVVLATRETLVDICPGIAGSPLVYRLIPMTVGLLDSDEAASLLAPPLPDSAPMFSLEDKALLVHLVGRHPYVLVRAARQAYERLLVPGTLQRLTSSYIWTEVASVLQPVFELLWCDHTDELRAFSRAHSQGGDSLDKVGSSPIVYRLQAQALIYESAPGRFAFFSPLFESFVRQKLEADTDVKVEAIGTPEDARRILDALGLDTGTKEGRLADLLATHAGEVLTDEYLLDEIWGESGQEHALYTAVARLRSKMRQHQDTLGRIVRDRKSGYYYVHE